MGLNLHYQVDFSFKRMISNDAMMIYCWWFRNPANQLIGSLSHYLQGFIHPRWLFGISSINSMMLFALLRFALALGIDTRVELWKPQVLADGFAKNIF